MPSLNFTVYVDKVESGAKPHTIRRGSRIKEGDRLYLFTGMRQKGCRRLIPPNTQYDATGRPYVIAEKVVTIRRIRSRRPTPHWAWQISSKRFGWLPLTMWEVTEMADRDGFDDIAEFNRWFDQYKNGEMLQLIWWIPSTLWFAWYRSVKSREELRQKFAEFMEIGEVK